MMNVRKTLAPALLAAATAAAAQTPIRETLHVETRGAPETRLVVRRGETVDLEVRLLNYARPVDLDGWTVLLHAQTNGQSKAESYRIAGAPGRPADGPSATNGWAYARVDVDDWLPRGVESATWTLECTSPWGWRVVRAAGPLVVRGTAAADSQAPLPIGEADAIRTEIAAAQTNAQDYADAAAFSAAAFAQTNAQDYADAAALSAAAAAQTNAQDYADAAALSAAAAAQTNALAQAQAAIAASNAVAVATATNLAAQAAASAFLPLAFPATGTVASASVVTGSQSNALATALQPAWATTGTVSRAQMADMLKSPSGRTWLEVANGNTYILEVTNSTSVYVVSTEGEGYNGPAAGTVWSGPPTPEGEMLVWPMQGDWQLYSVGLLGFYVENTVPEDDLAYNTRSNDGTLPSIATPVIPDSFTLGSLVIDWVPSTNVYQIATEAGTVILIGNHDADPAAHPTLARTNDLPSAGCTDISATGIITGTTANYVLFSATNYTLSVSASASRRWNYSVLAVSTGAVTFAEGIRLFGTYSPEATNRIVVGSYTGTLWQAQGGPIQ